MAQKLDNDVKINGILEISKFISIDSTRHASTVSQIGTTVIGSLGDFSVSMQGGVIQYINGTTVFIVGYINPFSLVVSPSQTESEQDVVVIFGGAQISGSGVAASNINTNNLTSVALSATNITAFNDINAFNNITATNTLIGNSLNTVGNATIGGNITVNGTVNLNNVAVAGNITAAGIVQGGEVISTGDVTATGTVQGSIVNSTGNITAAGNIQSTNITATNNINSANFVASNNITATGTVTGTNLVATNQITTNNFTSTGTIVAPTISAGAGGVQSTGNISTTNGNITTTNGNITSTAGTIQSNNVIVTGTLSAQGPVRLTSTVNAKGEIAVSDGTSITGQAVGTFGSPLYYNTGSATGLSSGTVYGGTINWNNPTGWTIGGGGTFRVNLIRLGQIAIVSISPTATNYTNNSGGNLSFTAGYGTMAGAFLPSAGFQQYTVAIQGIINGTVQQLFITLTPFNWRITATNTLFTDGADWPNGTVIIIPTGATVVYGCAG